jgi:5-methylcytosine-specific restriction endonuclease McrA
MSSSRIRSLRRQACARQGWRCVYCDAPIWLQSPYELPLPALEPRPSRRAAEKLRCTAEHLTPKGQGGADSASNVAAACSHCNQTRHKRKLPPEPGRYRAEVRRRMGQGKWHDAWVHRVVAWLAKSASAREALG